MTTKFNSSEYVEDYVGEREYDMYDPGQEISAGFYYFAKYTTTYLQPILCCFGLFGNLASFIIFLSSSMRKISSNLYLAGLSASCYGFNMVLLCQWLEMVNIEIMNMQGFCQAIVYLAYVLSFLSVWLIVCITVENYVVTFHLSKAMAICTVFRAKIVISSLVGYSVVIYSVPLWTTRVQQFGPNTTICTEVPEYALLNRLLYYWDTVTTLFLPFIITSCLIVAILVKNLWIGRHVSDTGSIIHRTLSRKQKSLVKITRVLLAISMTYVILSGPSHANKLRHLILVEISGQRFVSLFDRILQQMFQIVYYLSFSLNVIYYLIWSNNFKQEFLRLFCLRKKRQRSYRTMEQFRRDLRFGEQGQVTQRLSNRSSNPSDRITMV